MPDEHVWQEYEQGVKLEQELVRNRWTYFTAMLSVSLIVGALAFGERESVSPFLRKAGCTFGWLIFLAAYYHYWWFHRKAEDIRKRICTLEGRLEIEVYRIRVQRPTFWDLGILRMLWWVLRLLWRFFWPGKAQKFPWADAKLYYHWATDLVGIAYTVILIVVLFWY